MLHDTYAKTSGEKSLTLLRHQLVYFLKYESFRFRKIWSNAYISCIFYYPCLIQFLLILQRPVTPRNLRLAHFLFLLRRLNNISCSLQFLLLPFNPSPGLTSIVTFSKKNYKSQQHSFTNRNKSLH